MNDTQSLLLIFGKGNYFIGDYGYDDNPAVGICVYKNNADAPHVGMTDEGSRGKTTEEVGALLKLEFSNAESVDVWIRALTRAKETLHTGVVI